MSIRAEIQRESVEKELVVEHDGKRYLLRGREDAEVLTTSMLRSGEKTQKATHWARVLMEQLPEESQFSTETVKNVLVVHKVLVPAAWDDSKKDWVTETPYDETEIALLVKKNGPLFLKLLAGAYEVLGIKEDVPVTADELVKKTAAKNSEKPAG